MDCLRVLKFLSLWTERNTHILFFFPPLHSLSVHFQNFFPIGNPSSGGQFPSSETLDYSDHVVGRSSLEMTGCVRDKQFNSRPPCHLYIHLPPLNFGPTSYETTRRHFYTFLLHPPMWETPVKHWTSDILEMARP